MTMQFRLSAAAAALAVALPGMAAAQATDTFNATVTTQPLLAIDCGTSVIDIGTVIVPTGAEFQEGLAGIAGIDADGSYSSLGGITLSENGAVGECTVTASGEGTLVLSGANGTWDSEAGGLEDITFTREGGAETLTGAVIASKVDNLGDETVTFGAAVAIPENFSTFGVYETAQITVTVTE
jgi:hypothetical protein